jgi:hypothetical protein
MLNRTSPHFLLRKLPSPFRPLPILPRLDCQTSQPASRDERGQCSSMYSSIGGAREVLPTLKEALKRLGLASDLDTNRRRSPDLLSSHTQLEDSCRGTRAYSQLTPTFSRTLQLFPPLFGAILPPQRYKPQPRRASLSRQSTPPSGMSTGGRRRSCDTLLATLLAATGAFSLFSCLFPTHTLLFPSRRALPPPFSLSLAFQPDCELILTSCSTPQLPHRSRLRLRRRSRIRLCEDQPAAVWHPLQGR